MKKALAQLDAEPQRVGEVEALAQRLTDTAAVPEGDTEGDADGEKLTQPIKKAEPSRPAVLRRAPIARPSR